MGCDRLWLEASVGCRLDGWNLVVYNQGTHPFVFSMSAAGISTRRVAPREYANYALLYYSSCKQPPTELPISCTWWQADGEEDGREHRSSGDRPFPLGDYVEGDFADLVRSRRLNGGVSTLTTAASIRSVSTSPLSSSVSTEPSASSQRREPSLPHWHCTQCHLLTHEPSGRCCPRPQLRPLAARKVDSADDGTGFWHYFSEDCTAPSFRRNSSGHRPCLVAALSAEWMYSDARCSHCSKPATQHVQCCYGTHQC